MKLLNPAMFRAALRRQLAAARPGLSQAVQERWYLTAGICLILASAWLRFYGLTDHGPRGDELNLLGMQGSFAEMLAFTRSYHGAPVLWPIGLWIIQKIDVSFFSLRVIPATAGVLTTGALLALLPRAGLPRRAAFLAALLATLCTHLLWHNQDAREYGLDALLAVLLVAGLFGYLRGRRPWLLCVSLFLAPLLQYGLVFFGAVVLGAALIHPPARSGPPTSTDRGRLYRWLRQRFGLVWPAASFLAGCAVSYGALAGAHVLTLREQLYGIGYFEQFTFHGDYRPFALIDFAASHTWGALNYLLPAPIVLWVLVCLGWFLLRPGARRLISRRRSAPEIAPGGGNHPPAPDVGGTALANRSEVERRSNNVIITLFLMGLAMGVVAAVANWYPLGYTRHSIYLGPAVFLAAGVLTHAAINYASGLFRRRDWSLAALFLLASGLLLSLSLADLQTAERWRPEFNIRQYDSYKSIAPYLNENVLADDVFVSYKDPFYALAFYGVDLTDSYYEVPYCLPDDAEPSPELQRCVRYAVIAGGPEPPERLYFVASRVLPVPQEFAKWSEQTLVQPVITHLRGPQLHLITNLEAGWSERYAAVTSGEPVARADFEVYLDDNELHYAKEPCAPSDTADTFLLHLVPADVGDLPEWRRGYDTDNLDFRFDETYFDREVYAARFDGKCLASVALPDYPIIEIRTGQLRPDGSALWRVNLAPNQGLVQQAQEKRLLDYRLDYRAVASGQPAARAVFAMYLDGRTLHYAKEPCGPADTEATFLLHLIPQDADDLPESASRRYGFENRDFTFTDHGAEFDGKCLASVPLPDYPIAVIRTGQYRPDGQRLWTAEFPAGR